MESRLRSHTVFIVLLQNFVLLLLYGFAGPFLMLIHGFAGPFDRPVPALIHGFAGPPNTVASVPTAYSGWPFVESTL